MPDEGGPPVGGLMSWRGENAPLGDSRSGTLFEEGRFWEDPSPLRSRGSKELTSAI